MSFLSFQYIAELYAVKGREYLKYKPSHLAASISAIALYLTTNTQISAAEWHGITDYAPADLLKCIEDVCAFLHEEEDTPLLKNIHMKYANER